MLLIVSFLPVYKILQAYDSYIVYYFDPVAIVVYLLAMAKSNFACIIEMNDEDV